MTNLTLFSQITRLLPREKVRSLIKEHQSDKNSKGYDTWTHLIAMTFCHFAKCNSVRDVSLGMTSATGNLNHLGVNRAPSKSSVSYANKNRDWRVFRDIYFCLQKELAASFPQHKPPKTRLQRKIFAVDSTTIPLCLQSFDWARYRRTKGAIKIHALLDYDGLIPSFIHLTEGRIHDMKVARNLQIKPGSVILMDRAYLDFDWLRVLDSTGVFFVTRMKKNISFDVEQEFDTQGNPENILADEDIRLLGQHTHKKYPKKLRMVRVFDQASGKHLEFLTNNMEWKASTIAALYRERWRIEVFFKEIKQNLRIKSFIGTTPNAVLIQVWTAMITILLLKYLKQIAKYPWNLSNLVGFIRLNLFVKIDLHAWLNRPFKARGSPIVEQLKLFAH